MKKISKKEFKNLTVPSIYGVRKEGDDIILRYDIVELNDHLAVEYFGSGNWVLDRDSSIEANINTLLSENAGGVSYVEENLESMEEALQGFLRYLPDAEIFLLTEAELNSLMSSVPDGDYILCVEKEMAMSFPLQKGDTVLIEYPGLTVTAIFYEYANDTYLFRDASGVFGVTEKYKKNGNIKFTVIEEG